MLYSHGLLHRSQPIRAQMNGSAKLVVAARCASPREPVFSRRTSTHPASGRVGGRFILWQQRLVRCGSRVAQTSNAYLLSLAGVGTFPVPRSGGQNVRETKTLIN
jgi:hypothetical protein